MLEGQVQRMLADPRADALVENFFGQWLMLRNMKVLTPDQTVYPAFDDNLRHDLARETELFLGSSWTKTAERPSCSRQTTPISTSDLPDTTGFMGCTAVVSGGLR